MGWPEEKWPFFLAPLLTGEAQSAYQAANPLGNTAYAIIKGVILDHLGLDQEAYRVRFRKERGVSGENPKTLFFRLRMAADKWLRPDLCSKEEILKVYLEQFMEALPYATQRWLRQHAGLDIDQAIEMASHYTRAQPKTSPWEHEKTHKTLPPLKIEKRPKAGNEMPKLLRPTGMMSPMAKGPQCFECGEWGHIARMCPRKKAQAEPMEVGYLPKTVMYSAEMGSTFYVSMRMNGFRVRALLDSGCRQSVIQARFVSPDQIIPQNPVYIRCVHGDVKPYPVASITIVLPDREPCTVRVGVVDTLPEDMILGTDNPDFLSLFRETLSNPEQGGALPTYISPEPWVIDRSFRFAQGEDRTIFHAWESAHATDGVNPLTYPRFLLMNDLLYRQAQHDGGLQLVVPRSFREQVLFFAHAHLTAQAMQARKKPRKASFNIFSGLGYIGMFRTSAQNVRYAKEETPIDPVLRP
ncbi:uncharacterized protein LOC144782800 [Lissotriton helveticus]